MSEHTKALLYVAHDFSWPELCTNDYENTPIASVHTSTTDRFYEDARRLIACWNAFDGISTENIEANIPVKELADKYNAALRQRDQLLEALHVARFELRRLLDSKGVAPRLIREWPEIVRIDAAIAAAERGEL